MHATDATNACRTLLYNIETNRWDPELLEAARRAARRCCPRSRTAPTISAMTDARILGAPIPIRGVAGDQQAATIGQACFKPGMMKSTYGTGCFALLNTGSELVRSKHRLLTTIAYRLDGKTTYALEGAIFMAGASVQWLRDGLRHRSRRRPRAARWRRPPTRTRTSISCPPSSGSARRGGMPTRAARSTG